jgi:hypothetical protein
MARRRSFTSQLYSAARISNNISAIASANPRRVPRRAKSVALGRGEVLTLAREVGRLEPSSALRCAEPEAGSSRSWAQFGEIVRFWVRALPHRAQPFTESSND